MTSATQQQSTRAPATLLTNTYHSGAEVSVVFMRKYQNNFQTPASTTERYNTSSESCPMTVMCTAALYKDMYLRRVETTSCVPKLYYQRWPVLYLLCNKATCYVLKCNKGYLTCIYHMHSFTEQKKHVIWQRMNWQIMNSGHRGVLPMWRTGRVDNSLLSTLSTGYPVERTKSDSRAVPIKLMYVCVCV